MKRILLTLLLFFSFTAVAQSDHMSFKGIPMEGRVIDFVNKLKTRGYQVVTSGVDFYLTGDFAGYRNCTLMLDGTDADFVSRITVRFPPQYDWTGLLNDYNTIKKHLLEKYKAATSSDEYFDCTYSTPPTDRARFYEVQLGHCQYRTVFKGKKGEIVLSITHRDQSCFVALSYTDFANQALYHKKVIGDL